MDPAVEKPVRRVLFPSAPNGDNSSSKKSTLPLPKNPVDPLQKPPRSLHNRLTTFDHLDKPELLKEIFTPILNCTNPEIFEELENKVKTFLFAGYAYSSLYSRVQQLIGEIDSHREDNAILLQCTTILSTIEQYQSDAYQGHSPTLWQKISNLFARILGAILPFATNSSAISALTHKLENRTHLQSLKNSYLPLNAAEGSTPQKAIQWLSTIVNNPRLQITIETPEADKTKIRQAIAEFCHKLSLKLSQEKPNESYFFSPFSIYPVLGMLLKALDSDAKDKMIKQLNLSEMDEKSIHQAIGSLLLETQLTSDQASISVANAMISGANFEEASEAFRTTLRKVYDAEILTASAGNLKETVNKWVSEKTNKMINKLDVGSLGDDYAALLNAIYFKSDWAKPFDPSTNQDFELIDGEKISIPFMHVTEKMRYKKDKHLQVEVVEKNYKGPKGHNLSFVIFLPNKGKNLSVLEKRLTPETIKDLRNNRTFQEIELSMPKLNVSTSYPKLLDTLNKMGLPIKKGTLLPNLKKDSNPNDYKLDAVIHQAKMELDEKGTVAAAVTAALVMECTALPPEPITEVVVNRPFAYAIMDGDTVLFRGAVKDSKHLVK